MTPDKLAEMRDDEFCASLRATARTMELMGRVSEAREVREAVGRLEAAAQRADRAEAECERLRGRCRTAKNYLGAHEDVYAMEELAAALSPAPAAETDEKTWAVPDEPLPPLSDSVRERLIRHTRDAFGPASTGDNA